MAGILPLLPATARAMVEGQSAQMVPAAESHDVFTREECARIVALRDELGWDQARVEARSSPTEREISTSVRDTQRTHIMAQGSTQWIFDRLSALVERVNGDTWQLRVSHMEPLQLLRYPVGGHYSWHTDLGTSGILSLRKISVTIQLSDSDEFEGGQLELQVGGQSLIPAIDQGSAILFPAWQRHRVLPVTRGVRDSLVVWVVGKRSLR
jgi:PKHD-type hydroxylase